LTAAPTGFRLPSERSAGEGEGVATTSTTGRTVRDLADLQWQMVRLDASRGGQPGPGRMWKTQKMWVQGLPRERDNATLSTGGTPSALHGENPMRYNNGVGMSVPASSLLLVLGLGGCCHQRVKPTPEEMANVESALGLGGCCHQPVPEPAALGADNQIAKGTRMGSVPERTFSMRIGMDAATAAVGQVALDDCMKAISLGWDYCSAAVDRCSTLIVDASDQPIVMFDPDRCHAGADLDLDGWLMGSHHSPKVTIIRRRTSGDEGPVEIRPPPDTP